MGKQRVKFTFEETLVKEPVIYELGRKFKIVTNIRRAEVGETLGWVVLELDVEESEIQSGLEWVSSRGVRVDPLGGDVIDGEKSILPWAPLQKAQNKCTVRRLNQQEGFPDERRGPNSHAPKAYDQR